jgi:hypothetical protein
MCRLLGVSTQARDKRSDSVQPDETRGVYNGCLPNHTSEHRCDWTQFQQTCRGDKHYLLAVHWVVISLVLIYKPGCLQCMHRSTGRRTVFRLLVRSDPNPISRDAAGRPYRQSGNISCDPDIVKAAARPELRGGKAEVQYKIGVGEGDDCSDAG